MDKVVVSPCCFWIQTFNDSVAAVSTTVVSGPDGQVLSTRKPSVYYKLIKLKCTVMQCWKW